MSITRSDERLCVCVCDVEEFFLTRLVYNKNTQEI